MVILFYCESATRKCKQYPETSGSGVLFVIQQRVSSLRGLTGFEREDLGTSLLQHTFNEGFEDLHVEC